ncbi:methyl-accepting chemotaxis protein [Pseudomonas nicosulfuronedens]|uniref:methyl-accepting chemotaxis protein n=1 Tax=Pseudomonas nicosulfuronedens TaxID=2571105 RepID=UPI00148696A3|nr:methyl-accepting chemotaxis protein [Pseudomonas nicosulfuronedens]
MTIRNLRVSTRIAIAFAGLVVLLLVVGGGSLLQMRAMNESAGEVDGNWLPSILALGQMDVATMRLRASTLRVAVIDNETNRKLLAADRQHLEEAQAQYRPLISSDDEAAGYERFRIALQSYYEGQQQLLDLLAQSRLAEARDLISQVLNSRGNTLVSGLEGLTKLNADGAKAATLSSDHAYEEARLLVLVILIGAVVLAIILALVMSRSIVRPLAQAVEVARTVAAGDLTENIPLEGRDEASQLMEALRNMQQSLRVTISLIADSSSQLASASEELHAVTEDASRGLTLQNQEIEQAAAACNQMSAAVDGVANNASSTLESSRRGDAAAVQGRDQVVETVRAINALAVDMNASVTRVEQLASQMQQVGKVLDVIRSIAEQTNLLALNAAIEAARAGEQGRGFAVVADEVRMLAQRTQQSTQEIEQMVVHLQQDAADAVRTLQGSSALMGETVQRAEAANDCLGDITNAMAAINEQNAMIASAAEEQAAVAREVDRSLVSIRDLSAQSAAGASQTSASSQDLSRLAVQLKSAVSAFRV